MLLNNGISKKLSSVFGTSASSTERKGDSRF